MRKPMDYDELVRDYEARFGIKDPARRVQVLHTEEIDRLNTHPSDDELQARRRGAKPELCVFHI